MLCAFTIVYAASYVCYGYKRDENASSLQICFLVVSRTEYGNAAEIGRLIGVTVRLVGRVVS